MTITLFALFHSSSPILCIVSSPPILCILFFLHRIRKGVPSEARVVARVLPPLLLDFFPAQEIMNKVIGEFLSSQQPHPELMAQVLFKVRTGTVLNVPVQMTSFLVWGNLLSNCFVDSSRHGQYVRDRIDQHLHGRFCFEFVRPLKFTTSCASCSPSRESSLNSNVGSVVVD